MSPRNLITKRVGQAHRQMIVCQAKLNSELANATAKLGVTTRVISSLAAGHEVATLRTAKHLKEDLEGSRISVDDAHAKFIMNSDPGSDESFKARTLVTNFHNKINRAVAGIWGHVVAQPVDMPPLLPITDSFGTVAPAPSRISYPEKTKLPTFCGTITKYQDFKAQFQALIQDC